MGYQPTTKRFSFDCWKNSPPFTTTSWSSLLQPEKKKLDANNLSENEVR